VVSSGCRSALEIVLRDNGLFVRAEQKDYNGAGCDPAVSMFVSLTRWRSYLTGTPPHRSRKGCLNRSAVFFYAEQDPMR
jgi:hypothetical protein